jgi:seryl-tRNA synthetase
MNLDSLQSDWAVWLALAAVVVAVAVLAPRLLRMTSRSKLRRVVADLKAARKELRKSLRKTRKAGKKIRKYQARAERIKPRVMQEAKEAFEDAQALEKILQDKVMVAENHVRRVIHDEFPPTEHDRMREKYLAQDVKDERPFTF